MLMHCEMHDCENKEYAALIGRLPTSAGGMHDCRKYISFHVDYECVNQGQTCRPSSTGLAD